MKINEKNRIIKTLDNSKELYNSSKHNFEELNKNEDNATMYAQNNMKNAAIKSIKKFCLSKIAYFSRYFGGGFSTILNPI